VKKLLIAVPVIAGSAWAGTSYFAGVQSEAGYDQLLRQMGQLKPYTFEKESYDSGLTTSRAVTLVKASQAADAEIVVRLEHLIEHSPVRINDTGTQIGTATIRTTLLDKGTSRDPVIEIIKGFDDESDPFELVTTVSPSGDLESRLTTSDFAFAESFVDLKFGATDISATTIDNVTTGSAAFGALSIVDKRGVEFKLSESVLDVDVTHVPNEAPVADLSWTADKFVIANSATPHSLTMDGVDFVIDAELAGGLLNQLLSLEFKAIDFGDSFPGNNPVESLAFALQVNGLDKAGLDQYTADLNQMSMQDRLDLSDEEFKELVRGLKKTVSPESEFIKKLALTNAGGDANLDLALRSVAPDMKAFENVVTVTDLLNLLELDFDVTLDKAALEVIPELAAMIPPEVIEIGMLDDGTSLTSTARIRGTELQFNGDTLSLQEMSGGMTDMPLKTLLEMQGL